MPGKAIRAIFLAFILISVMPSLSIEQNVSQKICTYEVAVWNVPAKKVVEVRAVSHPYDDLTEEEMDSVTGCSICREDQAEVSLPSIGSFRVCRKLAPEVSKALFGLIEAGVPILSIRGYQVVRSRGEMDREGNRTMLSNHSFGTAIDINRERNGLYDNCVKFGPECRLVLGGSWRPGVRGTLVENGPVVRAMRELGFKWGGEINGRQKDFMHFSLTGY